MGEREEVYFVITNDEMLKTDIGVGKSVLDNPIPHVECAVIELGKRVCLFRHHG